MRAVERVYVNIGGEGARVVLIGWMDRKGDGDGGGDRIFQIQIGNMEQYNLLCLSILTEPR